MLVHKQRHRDREEKREMKRKKKQKKTKYILVYFLCVLFMYSFLSVIYTSLSFTFLNNFNQKYYYEAKYHNAV